jgi:hypothetical protein
MDGEFSEYSAPVGSNKKGRLILTSSVSCVRLMACLSKGDLYQVRFRGLQPVIHLKDGMLTVQTSAPLLREDNLIEDPPLHICLNSTVSWEVEFRGRVENMQADLRGIRLHSMDILGDARQIDLFLPLPQGAAFLYVSGGIRQAVIHRPSGVGMRFHVGDGIEKCIFDHQILHTVRSETSLESKGFSPEDGYYDLTINGSAKYLTLAETAGKLHE